LKQLPWLAISMVLLCACATLPTASPPPPPPPPEQPYEIIRIFYGTDRAPTGSSEPNAFYGGERSRDGLVYGTCEVSILRRHEVGEIERPRWWKLEFREDPEKHVVLARVLPQTRDRFFTLLSHRVGESARREAFLFIHGFNVSFPEAVWRTGQIAYDLKFDGAPILYSWPSQGGTLEYTVDETNVRWTESHLERFLDEVVGKSGAERLYLIAHSMGNRALTEVLKDLAVRIREGEMPAFTEIFLTAPDIDADTFREEIAPKITAAAHHVTLYASDSDKALKISKGVNGYPRAGDAGNGLVVVEGIDTIDATEVSTDFLGHSYFDSVVPDIDLVVRQSLPPPDRGLLEVLRGTLRYWMMVPREE
jgi:esterase/lipase superfamily enzyme